MYWPLVCSACLSYTYLLAAPLLYLPLFSFACSFLSVFSAVLFASSLRPFPPNLHTAYSPQCFSPPLFSAAPLQITPPLRRSCSAAPLALSSPPLLSACLLPRLFFLFFPPVPSTRSLQCFSALLAFLQHCLLISTCLFRRSLCVISSPVPSESAHRLYTPLSLSTALFSCLSSDHPSSPPLLSSSSFHRSFPPCSRLIFSNFSLPFLSAYSLRRSSQLGFTPSLKGQSKNCTSNEQFYAG